SQKVATYDLKPERSAKGVAAALVTAVRSRRYDFAIVNFANPDMVGHTGDFAAALKAMEATDAAVGEVVDATLAVGGCVLVTADRLDRVPPRRRRSRGLRARGLGRRAAVACRDPVRRRCRGQRGAARARSRRVSRRRSAAIRRRELPADLLSPRLARRSVRG